MYGGAINNNGILTVNNSTFTSNTAQYYGGAIYNNDGTVTVNGSTFTSNTAMVLVVLSTIMMVL